MFVVATTFIFNIYIQQNLETFVFNENLVTEPRAVGTRNICFKSQFMNSCV